MSIYSSTFIKGHNKLRVYTDNVKSTETQRSSRENQCVISPSLLGTLKHCLRTEDVCAAAVTYYLKSVETMSESTIRAIAAYLRNSELNNFQVAARVRKTIPKLPDDRHLKIKYSLVEFISNTLDPTLASKTPLSKTETRTPESETKDEKLPVKTETKDEKLPVKTETKDEKLPVKTKRVRRSQIELRRKSSSKLKKSQRDLRSPSRERAKMVEVGRLKVMVKESDMEDIVIETRQSVSAISHALDLKADSEDVAQGIGVLRALSGSELGDILEAERRWQDVESDDEKDLQAQKKGKTSGKADKATGKGQGARQGKDAGKRKESGGAQTKSRLSRDSQSSDRSDKRSLSTSAKMSLGSRGSSASDAYRGGQMSSDTDDEGKRKGSRGSRKHSDDKKKKSSDASRKSRLSDKSSERRSSAGKTANELAETADEHSDDNSGAREGSEGLVKEKRKSKCPTEQEPERIRYMTVDLNQPYPDRPHTPVAPDQHSRAKEYYETKGIAQIFETFLCRLVIDRPSRPLDYLIDLARKMNISNRKEQEIEEIERRHSCPLCAAGDECRASAATGICPQAKGSKASSIWSSRRSTRSEAPSLTPVDGGV